MKNMVQQNFSHHNACAHIDGLLDVVKGVEHWLAEDGVFVLEVVSGRCLL